MIEKHMAKRSQNQLKNRYYGKLKKLSEKSSEEEPKSRFQWNDIFHSSTLSSIIHILSSNFSNLHPVLPLHLHFHQHLHTLSTSKRNPHFHFKVIHRHLPIEQFYHNRPLLSIHQEGNIIWKCIFSNVQRYHLFQLFLGKFCIGIENKIQICVSLPYFHLFRWNIIVMLKTKVPSIWS